MNNESVFRPWLEDIADAPLWIVILMKVSILLAAAWTVHAALFRSNPRWRVLAWRGTAVGLILIPILHVITPPIKISILRPSIATVGSNVAIATNEPIAKAVPDSASSKPSHLPSGDFPDHHVASGAGVDESRSQWWPVLLVVWGFGVCFYLLRMIVGQRQISWLIRRS